MAGKYTPTEGKTEECDCQFTLTINSADVESMIDSDPNHQASLSGTVMCPALSAAALTVSSGQSSFSLPFHIQQFNISYL